MSGYIFLCNQCILVIIAKISASLLQSSVSHDPPVQETFIIIFFLLLLLLLSIFKTVDYIFFKDSLMNKKIQRSAFIWTKKLYIYIYIYIYLKEMIEINTFVWQWSKLIESYDKGIYIVTKDFYFR